MRSLAAVPFALLLAACGGAVPTAPEIAQEWSDRKVLVVENETGTDRVRSETVWLRAVDDTHLKLAISGLSCGVTFERGREGDETLWHAQNTECYDQKDRHPVYVEDGRLWVGAEETSLTAILVARVIDGAESPTGMTQFTVTFSK